MGISAVFGYVAILGASATLGTFVTGILFFQKGGKWGPVNDVISIAQMMFILPLVWAMFMVSRTEFATLSVVVLVTGIVGIVVPMATQTLLVARVVSFKTSNRIGTPVGILIGVWLIAANLLSIKTVPAGLAIVGMISGAGYILLVAGFLIGRQKHFLFTVGSVIALTGYIGWAVWIAIAVVR